MEVTGAPDIAVYHSITEAEAMWRALAAERQCYVFQTFEWILLWYQTIGGPERVEPYIVFIKDGGGQPLMMVPLGIRRRYGCRILTFLGGDVTDYNAPLCSDRFTRDCDPTWIDCLWQKISKLSGADLVWLQRMPETLPDGVNPLIAEAHAHHTDNAYAATSLPATFAEFAVTRSRSYFADTRRKHRKLERLGELALDLPQSQEGIAQIVDAMLRQKRRRISDSKARPMPPLQETFYRSLASATFQHGRPHVASLRIGGELVATHLGMLHRNRFYWLMPGFEGGDWARLSVGRILLQCLIEWCIVNRIDSFDLTVGDEEYKRFWADTRLKLYESRYAQTVRGACFLAGSRLRALAGRIGVAVR